MGGVFSSAQLGTEYQARYSCSPGRFDIAQSAESERGCTSTEEGLSINHRWPQSLRRMLSVLLPYPLVLCAVQIVKEQFAQVDPIALLERL